MDAILYVCVHVCVLIVVLKGGRAAEMVGGEWGVGLRIPLSGGGESQSNRIRGYTNSKTAQCCQNGLVRASRGGRRRRRRRSWSWRRSWEPAGGLIASKHWKRLEHLQIFCHIWTVWHRLQRPPSFIHNCLPKNSGWSLLILDLNFSDGWADSLFHWD